MVSGTALRGWLGRATGNARDGGQLKAAQQRRFGAHIPSLWLTPMPGKRIALQQSSPGVHPHDGEGVLVCVVSWVCGQRQARIVGGALFRVVLSVLCRVWPARCVCSLWSWFSDALLHLLRWLGPLQGLEVGVAVAVLPGLHRLLARRVLLRFRLLVAKSPVCPPFLPVIKLSRWNRGSFKLQWPLGTPRRPATGGRG